VIRIADFFLIFLSFTSRKAPFFYIKIHGGKSLSIPNPKGLYYFLTNYCYCSLFFWFNPRQPIDMGQGGACLEGCVCAQGGNVSDEVVCSLLADMWDLGQVPGSYPSTQTYCRPLWVGISLPSPIAAYSG
jgi:hypothetical protein